MGGLKQYIAEGGFSQWLYKKVGETISYKGMSGKIVAKIDDTIPNHAGLPLAANTSDFYIKLSKDDGMPEQIRIYENRKAHLDLDWNHEHKQFKIGTLHVHDYVLDDNGKPDRQDARSATNAEIKKYGALIKKLNPKVKLKIKSNGTK
jgi:hypothetical protein